MKKNRLIPVLLLKDGWLVQSKGFSKFQNLGNPVAAVKRLSEWGADELIYLDISKDEVYDLRRNDIKNPNRDNILDILEDVSKVTFMPITIGGKIRSLTDIEARLKRGADKISINTQAVADTDLITSAAKEFGSQCIVVSIDVKTVEDKQIVFTEGGKKNTGLEPVAWAIEAQEKGAGEILLNSIDRDGTKSGFDTVLIARVTDRVKIPVIAMGGAGEWEHFGEVFKNTGADAVAAANIFQHIDQSVYLAKKYLHDNHFNVRPPFVLETNFSAH